MSRTKLCTETRNIRRLPVQVVVALFHAAWAKEVEETEFRDDEDPREIAAAGAALVAEYMQEVAPTINPAAVEIHVTGEISGVRVQGWIDLLDMEGRVIEIKTAKARPHSIRPMQTFQVATYAQLLPCAGIQGRIDTLVKTKAPQVVTQTFPITDAERRAVETIYPVAQQAMRRQDFMPNRSSMLCSRRNCSYWRICEREWGGQVPES